MNIMSNLSPDYTSMSSHRCRVCDKYYSESNLKKYINCPYCGSSKVNSYYEPPSSKFKVGDSVVATADYYDHVKKGMTGVVRDLDNYGGTIGIQWDYFNDGNDLNGKLPRGSKQGYYVPKKNIMLASKSSTTHISDTYINGTILTGVPASSYTSAYIDYGIGTRTEYIKKESKQSKNKNLLLL
jgi:hypothetical protein